MEEHLKCFALFMFGEATFHHPIWLYMVNFTQLVGFDPHNLREISPTKLSSQEQFHWVNVMSDLSALYMIVEVLVEFFGVTNARSKE